MRLENSFTVAAPLERTWQTLLDIERVATCLPGAKIEPTDDDGVYRGAMKIKLGPMTVDYRGTARLQDVDEDTHTASIAVQAREARGQGTAAAVISNRLEAVDGGTRVIAETDLNITGRQAQFGRGVMADVAETMMGQFAKRLEAELQRPDTAPSGAPSNGRAAPAPDPAGDDGDDDVLDVGSLLAGTQLARYGAVAAGVVALLVLLVLLRRGGGRQLTINIDLRR